MNAQYKYSQVFVETLAKILAEAGFSNPVRSEFMASAHEELRVDEHSSVAAAKYSDRYYSLFVEAQRQPGADA